MQYYTMEDYIDLVVFLNKNVTTLNEEKAKYKLDKKDKSENSKEHHKHDKIFRQILNNKKEVAILINQEIKPENEIKEEDIEKYETKYIVKLYKEKQADIVYKLKNKEVFYIWGDRLSEEEKEMIRKIIFKEERVKGVGKMSHAQEVIRKHEERLERKARQQGIISVAKNMLKEKFDIDVITKITGLRKEQFMK